MPALNKKFPWMSYYNNYNFFEDRMRSHKKVNSIKKISDSFYEIDLVDGKIVNVFICECYSFGVAEYYECVEKLEKFDAIIINSNWCGYTMEVKRYCREHGVGIFDIRGFMAALNLNNFWEYLTIEEKASFQENDWL
jgi:hypothetical protein